MPQISTITGGTANGSNQDALAKRLGILESGQQSIQNQLNTAPGYFSPDSTGKFASGTAPGSMHARQVSGGAIAISIAGQKGKLGEEVLIQNGVTTYLPPQTGAGAPTTTQFPTSTTYGWYQNTNNNRWYFVLNYNGSIVSPDLATLTGVITATQHGDLSGNSGTFHDFTQISGSITESQHGNLSGSSRHAIATGSNNGFMSSSDKAYLDSISDPTTSGGTQPINTSNLRFGGISVINGAQTGYSVTGAFAVSRSLATAASAITLQNLANFVFTMASDLILKRFPNP